MRVFIRIMRELVEATKCRELVVMAMKVPVEAGLDD
jgi:hypothetical protein